MTSERPHFVPGEPVATEMHSGWWADDYGIVGPLKPGHGARSDPRDDMSFGPEVGDVFPDIVTTDQFGATVDVHAARGSGPAVVVFSRATVW